MCGIFGVALKKGASHRLAMQKFRILGLYNIPRGKDASGIFVDGEIIKGIGLTGEFDDFISKEQIIPIPKVNGVVIGHVRQGSPGYKKTIEEAHPFLIDEDLIFSHNGTIRNVDELCNKYELTKSDFSVDSKVLGTALNRNGVSVLEEYTGAAALAYTYKSKPDVLYLYHGKSKEYKHAQAIEERPLWFMKTKEGIYYSSLENSLKAIRESDTEIPCNLKYNTVFTIENGQFVHSEEIEREEKNITTYYSPVVTYPKPKEAWNPSGANGSAVVPIRMDGMGRNPNKMASIIGINGNALLTRETLPTKVLTEKDKKGFIYFHMGRHWEAPRKLITGPIYLKKGGIIGSYDDKISKMFFFYRGVLLKDMESFKTLKAMEDDIYTNWLKVPTSQNFALFISPYAIGPVTNFEIEGVVVSDTCRKAWYLHGQECKSHKFTPLYGQRSYEITKGVLKKIKPFQREDVLYDSEAIAKGEVNAYVTGGLLLGTQGGSSRSFLFQEGEITAKSFPEERENDDKIKFFYEIPLVSLDQAMEIIGPEELEALKLFSRVTYREGYQANATQEDIKHSVNYLIDNACKENKSILDLLTNEHERLTLEDCYNKALEEASRRERIREQLMQPKLDFKEDITEEDITLEDMNIEDSIENIVNALEDIQVASADLMNDNEDNEYVQEVLNTTLVNIPNILSNLKEVFAKHNRTVLLARVNKIIDTQLMQ